MSAPVFLFFLPVLPSPDPRWVDSPFIARREEEHALEQTYAYLETSPLFILFIYLFFSSPLFKLKKTPDQEKGADLGQTLIGY